MFSSLIGVNIEFMIPNPDSFVEGYVADEIITSAAGTRVRVGNTDAEGRMAMADAIHHMKQRVTSFSCRYICIFMFILSLRLLQYKLKNCNAQWRLSVWDIEGLSLLSQRPWLVNPIAS